MKSNRILIWRFADAPDELRRLFSESQMPEWVMLAPRAMCGEDLDQAVRRQADQLILSRHEMPNGDVVYAGLPRMS